MVASILLVASVTIFWKISSFSKQQMEDRERRVLYGEALSKSRVVDAKIKTMIRRAMGLGSIYLSDSKSLPKGALEEKFRREHLALESEMVGFTLYRHSKAGPMRVHRIVKKWRFKDLETSEEYFNALNRKQPLALGMVFGGQIDIKVRNLVNKPLLFSLALPLRKSAGGKVTYTVVADFLANTFHHDFLFAGNSRNYLVDRHGTVLVGPQGAKKTENPRKFSTIKKRFRGKAISGFVRYQSGPSKNTQLAAYHRSPYGYSVVSEIDEATVFSPLRKMESLAIYVMGAIFSAGVFVTFLFSLTITGPLRQLMGVARQISRGRIDADASTLIRRGDEVGELARVLEMMKGGVDRSFKNRFS